MSNIKRIKASFFKTESGKEPVRDWLMTLSKEDRQKIGEDIKTIEFGFPIGMPTCRPMGKGLYEVRTNLENTIARVLFCVEGEQMILLHGFTKKTQKTPKEDLNLAIKRQIEFKNKSRS
ncbi:type II toxin-antitoxin system RelE/ParE family toxin [Pseudanabaena minima]|uniref:type II toxin-antitoxin system RelE/ParE family toxin n=1 Tax=Pseudanabaena minima TaxID=890415 RepID=UPI003DA8A9B5